MSNMLVSNPDQTEKKNSNKLKNLVAASTAIAATALTGCANDSQAESSSNTITQSALPSVEISAPQTEKPTPKPIRKPSSTATIAPETIAPTPAPEVPAAVCSVEYDSKSGWFTSEISSAETTFDSGNPAVITITSGSPIGIGEFIDYQTPGDWQGIGDDSTPDQNGQYVVEFVNPDAGTAEITATIYGQSDSPVGCEITR